MQHHRTTIKSGYRSANVTRRLRRVSNEIQQLAPVGIRECLENQIVTGSQFRFVTARFLLATITQRPTPFRQAG